jgi:hypothetical protein
MQIVPTGLRESFKEGVEKRFGNYTFSFLCPDGVWETEMETVNLLTDPYLITLPDYTFETFFSVEFTTTEQGLYLVYNELNGKYIALKDIPSGRLLKIDGTGQGSIVLNSITPIHNRIAEGIFFPLDTGLNKINILINDTIVYSDPIEIKYRSRYAY